MIIDFIEHTYSNKAYQWVKHPSRSTTRSFDASTINILVGQHKCTMLTESQLTRPAGKSERRETLVYLATFIYIILHFQYKICFIYLQVTVDFITFLQVKITFILWERMSIVFLLSI